MKRTLLRAALLIVWMMGVCLIHLQAQKLPESDQQPKEIAITIDDLPLNGSLIGLKRLQRMTDKLQFGIKRYQIPVVGFVNESLLYIRGETDLRIKLLKSWADSGVELGNHTYSI